MTKLLVLSALFITSAAFAESTCTAHITDLKTGATQSAVMNQDPEHFNYTGEIDGFQFGATLENSEVFPGGGIFHKASGLQTFAQASTSDRTNLSNFFHATNYMGKWITMSCKPAIAE